jgi:hypothetical protein
MRVCKRHAVYVPTLVPPHFRLQLVDMGGRKALAMFSLGFEPSARSPRNPLYLQFTVTP